MRSRSATQVFKRLTGSAEECYPCPPPPNKHTPTTIVFPFQYYPKAKQKSNDAKPLYISGHIKDTHLTDVYEHEKYCGFRYKTKQNKTKQKKLVIDYSESSERT